MGEGARDASKRWNGLTAALERSVRERPYPALALAAMAGYLAGGRLFSAWTRPMARMAMGALLVPGFRARVRGIAGDIFPGETGAA